MSEPARTGDVVLKLSNDEALVLFELVSRFSQTDSLEIQCKAESIVLWGICCLLEKQLVEPWFPEYQELLRVARIRLGTGDPDATAE